MGHKNDTASRFKPKAGKFSQAQTSLIFPANFCAMHSAGWFAKRPNVYTEKEGQAGQNNPEKNCRSHWEVDFYIIIGPQFPHCHLCVRAPDASQNKGLFFFIFVNSKKMEKLNSRLRNKVKVHALCRASLQRLGQIP